MFSKDFTAEERRKLEVASGIAISFFPYLSGIFAKLDIRFDDRIDTAGVTGSGKLLVNRKFFADLAPGIETAFVLAHEMLHLAQMIFERGEKFPDPESVNVAHDILINEQLCDAMGLAEPPCGGLSWTWFTEWDGWNYQYAHKIPGVPSPADRAADYSLEELVRIIVSVKDTGAHPGRRSWPGGLGGVATNKSGEGFSNTPFADIFGDGSAAEGKEPKKNLSLDLFSDETENELFPDEDRAAREKARATMREACRDAAVKNVILSSCGSGKDWGTEAGDLEQTVDIVRSCYVPPWQMAMQRWFDGAAVPRRSYARASRRGAWRSDVILPGRDQECRTLHIVLDTSGSMTDVIPSLLGRIAAFARNVGMEQAHIMQCDTRVTADEFVDVDRLEKYRVAGYGGSDMSPAMLKLTEDPEVTNVLVITDGYIEYPPEEEIPYDVLWCIPGEQGKGHFPYGKVVCIPDPERA